MRSLLHRARARLNDVDGGGTERGSATLYLIGAAIAIFMIIGLVVDGGGQLREASRADDAAAQAARVAGQALSEATSQGTGSVILNEGAAIAAGQEALDILGVDGEVVIDGDRITVNTDVTYETIVLPMILISELPAHGTATVQITPGIDDAGVIS